MKKLFSVLTVLLLVSGSRMLGQSSNLWDVQFADASTVYAVGDAGSILKSTNGGTSWVTQYSGTGKPLLGVSFRSASTGGTAGGDVLNGGNAAARTVNGGSNWSGQPVPSTRVLSDVWYVDATTGYISGYWGTILKTIDGGSNWVSQTTGTSANFHGVSFANTSLGVTVGDYGLIMQTSNGGASWSAKSSGTSNNLRDVQMVNATFGVAVGFGGKALRTNDGGNTWSLLPTGTTSNLQSVSFVNSSTGWIVGAAGTILYTTDGGSTWTNRNSLLANWYGVSFISSSTGIAVGDGGGVIVRTNDGGSSWTRITDIGPGGGGGTIPSAPALASPANGVTGQSTTLTLSWNASAGATSYRLQVSSASDFSTLVVDDATLTTTSRQVSGLVNNALYYWRASATNSYGTSPYSSTWNFTTAASLPAIPPSPSLVTPTNGAVNQATSLALSWNASSGATSYRVQVSTVSDFSSTLVDDATVTTTSKQVGPLANNLLHYWRVSASNSGGASAFSAAWSFTTVANLPTATTSAAGSIASTSATMNGSVNPNGAATNGWFEWGTSSTLASYASTSSVSVGSGSSAVAMNSSLTTLTAGTTYFYRAVGQNSAGTHRGAILNFVTTAAPAPAPAFAVTPSSINFGTVKVGTPKIDSVTVTNSGNANLVVSSITSSSSKFVVSPASGTVAPGGSMKVYITFTATNKTTVTATITFTHNASGSPNSVSVTGKGGAITAKNAMTPTAAAGLLPTQPSLNQNYPNPFNPTTQIGFELPERSNVRLAVFNVIGEEVAVLVDGETEAGYQSVQWSVTNGAGASLPSGVYIYRIQATSLTSGDQFQSIQKMVLMK